jgi:hypothetical protein
MRLWSRKERSSQYTECTREEHSALLTIHPLPLTQKNRFRQTKHPALLTIYHLPLALLPLMLTACLPSSNPTNPHLKALERPRYATLLAPFKVDLQTLGVLPRQAYGYAYTGEATNAFAGALKQFYAEYAGFCVLEQGLFIGESGQIYMTVAVKGKEVRAFVYDHSRLPQFEYLFLEGSVVKALVGVCPRP